MRRFRLVVPRFPYFNIYSSIVMPPLGAVSVATCVNNFTRFDVEIIDENNYKGKLDHKRLQQERPADVVGFYGGLTSTVPRLYEVAKQYKEAGVTTVAGGVHMHAMPEEALDSGIDFVADGEGEYLMPELLEVLTTGGDPASVDGLIFRKDGELIRTPGRAPITDLDALPAPDFTLLRDLKRKIWHLPISRTRGCNFACEFCSVKDHLGPCRSCSPETAYKQFVRYVESGHQNFFVVDDNFVQDREGTKELCRLLIDYKKRSKKKISIVVQIRADAARDREMLELMRAAGVTTTCIGYESPIDEDLRNMKKGVTVARLEKYTAILRSYGFYIHGMFIFGYPTFQDSEYRPSMSMQERTQHYLDFIKRTKIDTIQIMKPVPLPGTVLRERLEAENRVFPNDFVDWDKYDGNWVCFQPDEGCSPKELQNYATLIMRKFYNPLQMAKFIIMIPNYPLDLAFNTVFETARRIANHLRQVSMADLYRGGISGRWKVIRQIISESAEKAQHSVSKRLRNARIKGLGSLIYKSWKRNFRKERFYEVMEAASRRLKSRKLQRQ